MHVQEFYQMGVCVEWLNGLQYAPQRLRNLNEINKLLAHRPWLITKDHIQVAWIPLTQDILKISYASLTL